MCLKKEFKSEKILILPFTKKVLRPGEDIHYGGTILKNDVSAGFKNTLALKDLRLALEQGSIDGIDLNTGKSAIKSYEEADKTNYKDLDWTSMFNFIKEKNNLI